MNASPFVQTGLFFFNLLCKTVAYVAIQNTVVTLHATKFNIINFGVFPAECICDSNYFKNNHQAFT